jgi:hypothetical protein
MGEALMGLVVLTVVSMIAAGIEVRRPFRKLR